MKQRGRKSKAALSVVAGINESRPEPPSDLTESQASTWREIAAAYPVDWFDRGAQVLLCEYCRVKDSIDFLAKHIDVFEQKDMQTDTDLKAYRDMTHSRDKQQARLTQLATKMRLTNQARYDKTVAATQVRQTPQRKIWED